MIYNNNSINAILAMERDRTGNYGDDFYDDEYCCNKYKNSYLDEDDIADMEMDERRCGW